MKKFFGTIAIVVLAFSAGLCAFWLRKLVVVGTALMFLFSGCGIEDAPIVSDSGLSGTASDAGGLHRGKDGLISCPVPSPTGDGLHPAYFTLVSNSVQVTCEALKTSSSTAFAVPSGVDCAAPSRDFEGSTKVAWCVYLVEADGVTPCNGDVTGNTTCKVAGLFTMSSMTTAHGPMLIKNIGICSLSGVFSGWLCESFPVTG
jgi:hypothetical protein